MITIIATTNNSVTPTIAASIPATIPIGNSDTFSNVALLADGATEEHEPVVHTTPILLTEIVIDSSFTLILRPSKPVPDADCDST